MEQMITIDFPESLASSLKLGDEEFKKEMKAITLIKLYELGKISSGFAAKLLNMSRLEFIDLLAKYNVSLFNKDMEKEVEDDRKNA